MFGASLKATECCCRVSAHTFIALQAAKVIKIKAIWAAAMKLEK
jgi:hypothetical protein